SANGAIETPVKQVRQKAGRNRAIRDKGWHRLETALRNAARKTGTQIVLVNPAYTSQTCHRCTHVDSDSRKSQAAFECTKCGHTDHADVKADQNICHAASLAVISCVALAYGRSTT